MSRTMKVLNRDKKLDDLSKDEIIGRDASPKRNLNPPKFEEELIDFRNPNISWWSILIPASRDKMF